MTLDVEQAAATFPLTPFELSMTAYTEVVVGQLFARIADAKLGKDLQNNLSRLFIERSARLVRNDESDYSEPRSFDYAVATVAAPDLHLRFVRVRGEFSIDIAVPGEPRKWDALDSALTWLDMPHGTSEKADLPNWSYGLDWRTLDWPSVDGFLADNWDRIKAAASARSSSR